MAIFKILKGDSSRISLDVTPFTEGYAYFTPDDGAFYIDAIVDGERKRIRINDRMTVVEATLQASGWNGGKQTLTILGVTKDTDGLISMSHATEAQAEAASNASLYVSEQGKDSITVGVYGETPQMDIPVAVMLLP